MKKKEEKIGLTPVSLILSICGILIFASFIILPPVFRVVFKKEVVEPPKPEKVVIETMVCTRKNYKVGNHTESNEITMTYSKDSLRTYKKRTEQYYNNTVDYEAEKQNQGNLSTAYEVLDGVVYNVIPKDSEAKLIVEEDYDLSLFKAETYKLNDKEVEIKGVYKQGESVNGKIVSELTSQKYNCEKTETKEFDQD